MRSASPLLAWVIAKPVPTEMKLRSIGYLDSNSSSIVSKSPVSKRLVVVETISLSFENALM